MRTPENRAGTGQALGSGNMSAQVGYSGTPLAKKLGLKDGQSVGFIALPDGLEWLASERDFINVEKVATADDLAEGYDVVHQFTDRAEVVDHSLSVLPDKIKRDGMIWVSWPKKAAKVPTDVTEDVIRDRALQDVLVDVKVCAVDEIWSGLKLVIRKELR